MKIAIVGMLDTPITKNSLGGTEIWTYHFAEKLVELGHDVKLYASEGSHFSGPVIESAKRSQIEIPGEILQVDKEKIIKYSVKQIKEVIKKQAQFDIIHISNCNFNFYLPYIKNFYRPVIITVHSYNFPGNEAGKLFKKYPEPFYVFNAESFKKTWPEPKKYQAIYTGINVNKFIYKSKAQNYIFWMGRIHRDKGIEDAMKFAAKSAEELIFAGPIRNQEYFDLNVRPYLSTNIKYVGELDSKKKVKYYGNAKAFLITTKRDESFGLVAAEAMACGTPVLAYNRGALSEIIEDGMTGYVVEPDNVDQLVEKSKQINQINRRKCRDRVEKKFNIKTMIKDYIELYKKLLEKNNGKNKN